MFVLTDIERFWFGVACLLFLIWFVVFMVPRLRSLVLDLIVLCRGFFASDPEFDERKRRIELDAASGSRRWL